MPSSDNAGRIVYLTEYQHIDEGVLAKLPLPHMKKSRHHAHFPIGAQAKLWRKDIQLK
jgi:hypothetical protein